MNCSRKLFNKEPEGSTKDTFQAKDCNVFKTFERVIGAHRDFTSFGSKLPTTPSTSKRSSNDCEKEKKSGVIEESNQEYLNQSMTSTPLNKEYFCTANEDAKSQAHHQVSDKSARSNKISDGISTTPIKSKKINKATPKKQQPTETGSKTPISTNKCDKLNMSNSSINKQTNSPMDNIRIKKQQICEEKLRQLKEKEIKRMQQQKISNKSKYLTGRSIPEVPSKKEDIKDQSKSPISYNSKFYGNKTPTQNK